jgi:autotransporter-associated beta strand protein
VAGGTIASEGIAGYWGNFGNIYIDSSNTLNFTSGGGGMASTLSAASCSLGGDVVFNVTRGPGAVDLLVSGNLQNGYLPDGTLYVTGGLTKSGDGVMVLTNLKSYSGATVVNGGTLELNGLVTNGPGVIGSSSSITVNSGGTLRATGLDGLGFELGSGPPKTLTINEGGTFVVAQNDHLTIAYDLNVAGGTISSEGSPSYWGNFGNIYFESSKTLNFTSGSGGTASTLSAASSTLGGNVVFNVTRGGGPVDLLVSGNLQNGYLPNGTLYITGSLTKRGNGVMVLTGTNTYTGVTTIEAGTLQMSENTYTNLATSGGDIQGGKAVLDYSASGATPAADVQALLAASYNSGTWIGGPIQNTTAATTGLSLGWADNPTAQKLTVMATYAGDADLSGKADVADLTALLNNYNKVGMVWANGDFNYDGTVNVADLTALLNNYNKSIGESVVAGTAVPEPSSIAMLAGIAAMGLLYWWRKRA